MLGSEPRAPCQACSAHGGCPQGLTRVGDISVLTAYALLSLPRKAAFFGEVSLGPLGERVPKSPGAQAVMKEPG